MKSIALSFAITAFLLSAGCFSTVPTTTPQPEGKHLFILSGQSNMAQLDPKISFTPTVAKAFGSNNIEVVKYAVGGSSIRSWCKRNLENPPPKVGVIPKVRGCHYDHLIKIVREAMAKDNFQTVTFVWMQGESDKRNPEYHAYLKELIRQLQNDLQRKDINVIIGRISDSGLYPQKPLKGKKKRMFEGANYIRRTQVEFAESYPNGTWINTDDLNDCEVNGKTVHELHYNSEGYRILGKRFAEAAIKLIRKGPQP